MKFLRHTACVALLFGIVMSGYAASYPITLNSYTQSARAAWVKQCAASNWTAKSCQPFKLCTPPNPPSPGVIQGVPGATYYCCQYTPNVWVALYSTGSNKPNCSNVTLVESDYPNKQRPTSTSAQCQDEVDIMCLGY